MSSSNCWFLSCIQISQDACQLVSYSHLLNNFPQFVVIHTVKVFGIVSKAEVDVFLELSCFFNDPTDVGNLISGSSAFSKSSLHVWKFMIHILLKPGLENFEHYFTRGFPGGSEGKASAWNAGGQGSVPWSERSPGEGNGNLLQYSCLENPMDRGAWWATVHGVAKSQTWLSNYTSPHSTSMWDKCNCVVVWAFFDIAFLGIGMKPDLFQSCGHCRVFQICWHIECSTFTTSSFRIWNNSN